MSKYTPYSDKNKKQINKQKMLFYIWVGIIKKYGTCALMIIVLSKHTQKRENLKISKQRNSYLQRNINKIIITFSVDSLYLGRHELHEHIWRKLPSFYQIFYIQKISLKIEGEIQMFLNLNMRKLYTAKCAI
jgi:hypothetical protein